MHSKICCITRQTDDGIQHITQLGTGNYNEKTAKLYTDLSLITTSPTIGRDATEFFRNMALENVSDNYDVLWVAPLQVKPLILKNIDHQIELARRGEPCGLFFKTNSVTDKEIIDKIAEASQAGVKTVMLVRGISCLVPGVEGYTENVRVVSIVGRMLEHSRIYGFGPRTNMKIYLASADLMTRNMDKRVEIAWPVLDEKLRDRILSYIDVSLSDTAKLRELLPNRRYTPLGFFAQVSPEGETIRFDSQVHFMDEARLKARMSTEVEVEREVEKREAVAAAEPETPVAATVPAAAAAAPAGASSAVASGAAPTAAASADASAGTATPATSETATVPPEEMSATNSAAPADAASGSPSADATGTSEPALEPDAIEPAEEVTTTAILPHIEQPPHKPSLLVRALAAAIRLSNRKK